MRVGRPCAREICFVREEPIDEQRNLLLGEIEFSDLVEIHDPGMVLSPCLGVKIVSDVGAEDDLDTTSVVPGRHVKLG